MASIIQQRALKGRLDGADTEFSRAKKMATLTLKKDKLNNGGKNTVAGYEQAMTFIEPFQFSGNEKQSLDAQNVYATYQVGWADLKQKSSVKGQTLGEFQNSEREIYFKIPQSNTSSGLQNDPYNVTLRASEIAQDLVELTSLVQERVDEMNSKGVDASSLDEYLQKLQRRTAVMGEFYNDYVEGNFSAGSTRPDVGIFIDSNQDDGGVYNVGIMPIEDLPPGVTQSDYKPLKDSAKFSDGFLPVRGKGISVNGVTTFKYGSDVWQDTKDPAGLTRKTGMGTKNNVGGGLNLSSAPFVGGDVKAKRFSKANVGSDDKGIAIWKTFYRDENNKLFVVDDDMLKNMSQDPGYKKDIENASVIYDLNVAKQLANEEGLESLSVTPLTTGAEAREAERIAAPIKAEESRREGLGFFGRVGEDFKAAAERGKAASKSRNSFFDNKNTPTVPEAPTVSSSPPTLLNREKVSEMLKGFLVDNNNKHGNYSNR